MFSDMRLSPTPSIFLQAVIYIVIHTYKVCLVVGWPPPMQNPGYATETVPLGAQGRLVTLITTIGSW